MTLRQRDPRREDQAHLDFVREQRCCVCRWSHSTEAAHIRMGCVEIGKEPTGMGEKPHDKWTVPLCSECHRTGDRSQHSMGEETFWTLAGLNPFRIAARLWVASGAAERERQRQPLPYKRRPPPKPRNPNRKKQQIPGRRFDGTPIPRRAS